MSIWRVELEPDAWIAVWDGDPGRTLRADNAKLFVSRRAAEKALVAAKKYRPFVAARIQRMSSKGGDA